MFTIIAICYAIYFLQVYIIEALEELKKKSVSIKIFFKELCALRLLILLLLSCVQFLSERYEKFSKDLY